MRESSAGIERLTSPYIGPLLVLRLYGVPSSLSPWFRGTRSKRCRLRVCLIYGAHDVEVPKIEFQASGWLLGSDG